MLIQHHFISVAFANEPDIQPHTATSKGTRGNGLQSLKLDRVDRSDSDVAGASAINFDRDRGIPGKDQRIVYSSPVSAAPRDEALRGKA